MSQQRRLPVEKIANAELEPNPTVLGILEDYLAQLEQGVPPHPEALLSRHPEVTDLLQEYLASLEFLHDAALKLRNNSESEVAVKSSRRDETWQLGDYLIIREIGRGGMGVVYEAEQISLSRRVALKVLPFAAALEGSFLERFKNEARAAAVLHHQHIVPVYSVGCERGVHYYAMQYIEGRSLAAVIRELRELSGLENGRKDDSVADLQVTSHTPGPNTEARLDNPETRPQAGSDLSTQRSTRCQAFFGTVARLGVQAAGALDYAHRFGVVHRDIKPANLLLDGHGDLWITDFGLAQIQSDPRLTMTGDIIGTLRYMSPEQSLGKRVVDHRVDMYSLGVTLYELLTLEPVFAGQDRVELLRQIAFDEPKPPRRIDPRIPPELETIVLKAMAKNIDERYATASDLGDDLERFLNDQPIRARRPTALQRATKWARRHRPIVATAGVALVVFFVLALVGSLASNALIKRQRDQARDERRRAEQAAQLAKTRLFEAKLAEARSGRWGRQIGQRFGSLQALTEAGRLAGEMVLGEGQLMELRNEAIACLALADIRIVKEWEALPAGSYGLAFDDDLTRYAYSDPRGNITIRRVDDGGELAVLPAAYDGPNNAATFLRFSPDGALLVARNQRRLSLWDWRVGKLFLQASLPSDWACFDFSPDGRYFTLAQPGGIVAICDSGTGNEVRRIKIGAPVTLVSWHPDGAKLAFVCSNGSEVQVRDVATGDLVRSWALPAFVWALAWHPQGLLLSTACEDGHVYVWESATGQPHAVLRGHTAAAAFVEFAPGGDALLSSGWDASCRLWDPWTGRELVRFGGDANCFSRDGRRMVSRAGTHITIWEVASSREYRALPWSPVMDREQVADGGGLSSDGRWLAIGAGEAFRIWDLKSGQHLATLPTTHAVAAAFHPSGTEVFTSSHSGLYRWPWNTEAGILRIGPALKLEVDGLLEGISLDREGRTLAVARLGISGGASIIELENPATTIRHVTHPFAAVSTSLSPDGKWFTTAVHKGMGVRVWEASTGQLVRELIPNEHNTRASFSPDGRWLLTRTANEFCFWEVGSWERVHVLRPERGVDGPGSAAFTSDGQLVAVTLSPSTVQLIDIPNWLPLARLQGPDLDPIVVQGFTPDGSLLVVARAAGGAHVWDLRRIREQLKALGLDWDLAALPPDTSSADVTPLRVEVQVGSFAQSQKNRRRVKP